MTACCVKQSSRPRNAAGFPDILLFSFVSNKTNKNAHNCTRPQNSFYFPIIPRKSWIVAPLQRGSLCGSLGIVVHPHSIRERQPLGSFYPLEIILCEQVFKMDSNSMLLKTSSNIVNLQITVIYPVTISLLL